jgi:hypothetical protein
MQEEVQYKILDTAVGHPNEQVFVLLKGQCHKIFDPRFFSSIDHP